ncbi:MAG: hypothetical protein ACP5J4_02915 [Anaerolineae bacterium]
MSTPNALRIAHAAFVLIDERYTRDDERGDADLRRDRRHRPAVHPPRRRGDGDTPREEKAIAAGRRRGPVKDAMTRYIGTQGTSTIA